MQGYHPESNVDRVHDISNVHNSDRSARAKVTTAVSSSKLSSSDCSSTDQPQETSVTGLRDVIEQNNVLSAANGNQSNNARIARNCSSMSPVTISPITTCEDAACDDSYIEHSELFNKSVHGDFDISNWDVCAAEFVTKVPFDINGLRKYVITCSREDMMQYAKDGRPWKTWVTSSRKGFNGVRRVARCKGSPMCGADDCPFLASERVPNRTQFKMNGACQECFTCGAPAVVVPCYAFKVIEFDETEQVMTVMHNGDHTCKAKKPKVDRQVLLKVCGKQPWSEAK
jgi:hypothetical protein